MILRKEIRIPIVNLALVLWVVIQVANAYDSCDVRHRFTPETRKYHSLISFNVNGQICHL